MQMAFWHMGRKLQRASNYGMLPDSASVKRVAHASKSNGYKQTTMLLCLACLAGLRGISLTSARAGYLDFKVEMTAIAPAAAAVAGACCCFLPATASTNIKH